MQTGLLRAAWCIPARAAEGATAGEPGQVLGLVRSEVPLADGASNHHDAQALPPGVHRGKCTTQQARTRITNDTEGTQQEVVINAHERGTNTYGSATWEGGSTSRCTCLRARHRAYLDELVGPQEAEQVVHQRVPGRHAYTNRHSSLHVATRVVGCSSIEESHKRTRVCNFACAWF